MVTSLSGIGREMWVYPQRQCETQWPGNFYLCFPEEGEILRGFSLNYLPPLPSVGFIIGKSDLV